MTPLTTTLALLAALAAVGPGNAEQTAEREHSQLERDGRMGLEEIYSGEVIIPAAYDFVATPAEGLVMVRQGEGVAWFDLDGRERIPFSAGWESGSDFSEGLAAARRDDKWGFIDAAGNVVIPPRFYYVDDFHDGRALMRQEDSLESTYIDRRGEPICDCSFRYALDFKDGYAVVGTDREQGILRRDGTLVLEPAFYRIDNEGGGRLRVTRKEGEEMYPVYTEGIFVDGEGVTWNDNLAPVNAMVQRARLFVGRFEDLLDHWLETGCPCRYPRFRELVMRSPERESLFNTARDRFLDRIDSGTEGDIVDYACRVCGTRYRATWYEYGAFAQGYNYELSALNVEELGAAVVRPVPFLRFKTGYEMRDQSRFREVEDVDEVLEYLARLAGEEESLPLLDRLRRWIGE